MHLTGIHHLTAVAAKAVGEPPLLHRWRWACVSSRRPSARTMSAPTTCSTPTASPRRRTRLDLLRLAGRPRAARRRAASCARACAWPEPGTLAWWGERFAALGVTREEIREARRPADARFQEDSEGQRLGLVDDGGDGPAHPWPRSPVPAASQIRGLGPITISIPEFAPSTRRFSATSWRCAAPATTAMPERPFTSSPWARAVRPRSCTCGVEPDLAPARPGAGGVHHVAFRTPDEDSYRACAERLRSSRVPSSGPVDRVYFKSLYFRGAERHPVLRDRHRAGPVSPPTSRSRASASASPCRRSWSRGAARSKRA